MAKVRFDMVAESSTTTGTGTITLGGAKNPGVTFTAAGVAVSDTFKYRISHDVNNEWETGTGTMASSTTFTRSVLRSSNANALVNFSAGNKTVELVLDSADIAAVEAVASDTVVGRVELATLAEAITGTDAARVISALVLAGAAIRSVNVQVFTASGTYTPTAGMKFCLVIGTGSGGGSGGVDCSALTDVATAGGGAAAGTCIELFSAATIGASQAVTIGAVGTAGSATGGTNGGTGGNTTLGALFTATGGGPGIGSGTSALFVQTIAGGAGGVPTGGLLNITGGPGTRGHAHNFVNATDTNEGALAVGGDGGASFWGSGGRGGGLHIEGANADTTATTSAGENGLAFGSGAGAPAAVNSTAGLAGNTGAPGVMFILEFV